MSSAGATTIRGSRGVPRREREAAILQAATHLFGAHGHAHVSLGAIAASADVSKALVLSYFTSKDALYLRCVEGVAARVLPPVSLVVQASPPGFPMALATMRATFNAVRDRPADWRLLADASLPPASPLHPQVAVRTAPLNALGTAGVLATLAANGTPEPDDVEALLHLWNSIVASAMEWWFLHPDETPDSLTDRFARIVLALLA